MSPPVNRRTRHPARRAPAQSAQSAQPAQSAQSARQPQFTRAPDSKFAAYLAVGMFWLLIVRVLVPGSFDYNVTASEMIAAAERDAFFNKVTWLTFAGVSGALVLSRAAAAMRIIRATSPFFLGLVLCAGLSVVWSIDRSATMARLFHLITLFLVCLAVTLVGWNERRFQETTRPVLTLLLLGSLIFGLVAPQLAITPPIPPDTKYYWHGLADQKNQLGALASLNLILWYHGWASRTVKFFTAALWGGVSAACLLLSRSSTSIMATALSCGFMLLMLRSTPAMRRYMPYVIGLLVTVTLIYGLAVLKVVPGLDAVLNPITDLAGKDRTFSNRAQIWEILGEHIRQNLLLGSGYGAYWTGPRPDSPSYVFVYRMFFYPGECHNGYLEVINDLGLVGLVLLLGFLWSFIRKCLQLIKINYAQSGLYFAILLQQLLTNLSESHWLFISIDFAVVTLATLCLARSSRAPLHRARLAH